MTMAKPDLAQDQTVEEILASIRQVINGDQSRPTSGAARPATGAQPTPRTPPAAPPPQRGGTLTALHGGKAATSGDEAARDVAPSADEDETPPPADRSQMHDVIEFAIEQALDAVKPDETRAETGNSPPASARPQAQAPMRPRVEPRPARETPRPRRAAARARGAARGPAGAAASACAAAGIAQPAVATRQCGGRRIVRRSQQGACQPWGARHRPGRGRPAAADAEGLAGGQPAVSGGAAGPRRDRAGLARRPLAGRRAQKAELLGPRRLTSLDFVLHPAPDCEIRVKPGNGDARQVLRRGSG